MSSLKIEERFSVQAPVERVWRFLLDPEQIAPCLPGAELLQIENERTFHGQMKVKVGPVTVAYQGTIELTHVDEAGRRVQMVGKGKEKGGAGSAKMTMESHLEPQPDGAVAIAVISDVELAGRIVRFGRGMIQSVSAQLFKQFAANVRQVLEGGGAGDAAGETAAAGAGAVGETGEVGTAGAVGETGEVGTAGAVGETGAAGAVGEASAAGEAGAAGAEPVTSSASEQAVPESAGEAASERESTAAEAAPAPEAGTEESALPATPAAAEAAEPGDGAARAAPASGPISTLESAAPSTPAAPAATPSSARVSEPAAAPRAAQAPQARTGRELAPRTAEPVRALPLLFRALWDVITGFFKRLLGRSR